MIRRYDMEFSYENVYYESDPPDILPEESTTGDWVRYKDIKVILDGIANLHKKANKVQNRGL